MFCGNCGARNEGAKFCTNCGTRIQEPHSDRVDARPPPDEVGADITLNLPTIEPSPQTIEKYQLEAYCGGGLPKEYAWVRKTVDIVLARNAFVIVSAAPVNRFTKATEVVAVAGLAGAVGGGLLISLPAAIIGSAYESLFGQHNKFDTRSLKILFDSGNAVWIAPSEAVFHSFEINGGYFGDTGCTYAIVGDFETANGKLKMCVSMMDFLFASASILRKAFKNTAYSFKHREFRKDQEMRDALKKIQTDAFQNKHQYLIKNSQNVSRLDEQRAFGNQSPLDQSLSIENSSQTPRDRCDVSTFTEKPRTILSAVQRETLSQLRVVGWTVSFNGKTWNLRNGIESHELASGEEIQSFWEMLNK